ncbi:MAG: hypothetical protein RKP20_02305 [Candidatus Competibacter sp.]|nr:hypothetical protein [Candidatus Competibacter sp.]MDS4039996.1 hypothetical protein [Candidatus Competibacter sp.]
MNANDRLKYLRWALVLFGLIMLIGFYPLTVVWPAGWAWHTGRSEYLYMIVGIYATLGAFLIFAAREPLKHVSLIWFTIISSLVHGGIMAIQSIVYPEHQGHLWGDVPALLLVAVVLAFLLPRGKSTDALSSHGQSTSVSDSLERS